jgi:hypothetical protein
MSLPVKALVSALLAVAATIAEEAIKETTRRRYQEQRRPVSNFKSSAGFSPSPVQQTVHQ